MGEKAKVKSKIMNIYTWNNLSEEKRHGLLRRTAETYTDVEQTVRAVFHAVAVQGDHAVADFTEKFDGVRPPSLFVSEEQIANAKQNVPPAVRSAIAEARKNIETFHRPQIPASYRVETAPGVVCRREWRAIDRVGLYVPGGSAPLVSTLLMLGIPAALAGCPDILVCTPPMKDGTVNPSILFTAGLLGIRNVAAVGGAQAIAAMAGGTESIRPVDKIFGPGNRFVAAAKAFATRPPYNIAIDVFAGPTELLVIADDSAPPAWIAADMLGQAEHGPDSHVLLVTTSMRLCEKIRNEITRIAANLPRREIALAALEHGAIILVDTIAKALEISNMYAPEHISLAVDAADSYLPGIRSAGSVFVGSCTSAVFGDYASGTNHTLPTSGAARSAGGITVESFMKPIFLQTMTEAGYDYLAGTASTLARAEGLEGHACAIDIRKVHA